MRTRLSLALALCATACGAAPLKLSGTHVIRYQGLRRGLTAIDRIQTQLRITGEMQLGAGRRLELRLTGGPNEAPNLSFNEIRDFFDDWPLYLERYYVEQERGRWRLRLGRQPPLARRSELIYDADVNVSGLTARWARGDWRLHLSATVLHEISGWGDYQPALGLVVERLAGPRSYTLGLHKLGSATELARARLDGRLRPFDSNRRRQLPDADGDGFPEVDPTSSFRLLEASARLPMRALGEGGRFTMHVVKNLGAPDRDRAVLFEFMAPEALPRTQGIVRLFRVEQDAVVSGYHGETIEGTNLEGLHALLKRQLSRTADFRVWYTTTRGLARGATGKPVDVDEFRVDFIHRF